jgi:DNA-binding LacI/PurR family transcriptional regulator
VRTLEEIAEATGVSTSTISRVLHGRDDVSSETREKVLGELRRANYSLSSKPSRRGRPSLRERKLKKIAVICRNHAEVRRNPFSAPILTAALEAGAPHGAEMLSVDWPDEQAAIPDQLQEADAAIALSFYLSRHIQTLGDRLPVVTIDTYCPGSGVDGVLPDYRGGTFEAVSALLAAGHTRISLTTAAKRDGDLFEAQIYDGARRALDLAGVAPWEHFVAGYASTPEDGYVMGKRLHSLERSHRPTALVGSDHGLLGALRAAHDLNIRVPEELALVGVDDIELGRYSVPRLSTVRVDKEALARTAVERALWRISNRTSPVCRMIIDCPFIQRDSCGTRNNNHEARNPKSETNSKLQK